jgi:hypothetical protein
MRSCNLKSTKGFDRVFCKMMAVFPCMSGAGQNPFNLRALRFENTCEKNQPQRIQATIRLFLGARRVVRGNTRCRCLTRFKFGSREFVTRPLVAGGQSGSFRSISGWIARPSAAICGIRLIWTGLRRIQSHPPFRPPGARPLPVWHQPPWPRFACRSKARPPAVADPGRPVVDLLIRHSSRQA